MTPEIKKLARAAWLNTHPDFRGTLDDGTRCVLKWVKGRGTCSVALESLSALKLACIGAVDKVGAHRLAYLRADLAAQLAGGPAFHEPVWYETRIAAAERRFKVAGLDPVALLPRSRYVGCYREVFSIKMRPWFWLSTTRSGFPSRLKSPWTSADTPSTI